MRVDESSLHQKIRLRQCDQRMLTSNLSQLLRGGVPVTKALDTIESVSEHPGFKTVVRKILGQIREGRSLSDGFAAVESSLPEYFLSMLRMGEASGKLDQVLEDLHHHLEKENERARQTVEALAYPAFVLLSGFVTLIILIQVVIPKMTLIYDDYGAALPGMTRAVLYLSRHFSILLAALAAGFGCFMWSFQKHRMFWWMKALQAPVLGRLLQSSMLTQFSTMSAMLLNAGIPVLQGLDLMRPGCKNPVLQRDISGVREKVVEGAAFSEALSGLVWIPRTARMILQTGEATGGLALSFSSIAREARQEFDSRIRLFMKVLEPLLILAVGLVVAFLVISVLLPIFELNILIR